MKSTKLKSCFVKLMSMIFHLLSNSNKLQSTIYRVFQLRMFILIITLFISISSLHATPPLTAGRVQLQQEWLNFSSSNGHFCVESKFEPNITQTPFAPFIDQGVTNDGICKIAGMSLQIPNGDYLLPSGKLIYTNGQNHYCEYLDSVGQITHSNPTKIAVLPLNLIKDGHNCEGFYQVAQQRMHFFQMLTFAVIAFVQSPRPFQILVS